MQGPVEQEIVSVWTGNSFGMEGLPWVLAAPPAASRAEWTEVLRYLESVSEE